NVIKVLKPITNKGKEKIEIPSCFLNIKSDRFNIITIYYILPDNSEGPSSKVIIYIKYSDLEEDIIYIKVLPYLYKVSKRCEYIPVLYNSIE
ncbi:hypothetical protein OFB78_29955, partial [Escherichia coli]|nr:hypothetical protein [Escherichia coli]